MKISFKIVIITLISVFLLCSCQQETPFDRSLAGTYEILNVYDDTDITNFTITPTGLLSVNGKTASAQITESGRLLVDYGDGVSVSYKYTYDKYLLTLTDTKNVSTVYVNVEDFTKYNENSTLNGKYIDDTASICIEFTDLSHGLLVGLNGLSSIPFTFNAHDLCLRLEYDIDGMIQFEYLLYELGDNTLTIKWPGSDDSAVLYPASQNTELIGKYALLTANLPDEQRLLDKFQITDDTHAIFGLEECPYTYFSNGLILFERADDSVVFSCSFDGLLLELTQIGGSKYVFINEAAFVSDEDEAKSIAGLYVSTDLIYMMEINPDFSGSLNIGGEEATPFFICTFDGFMQLTNTVTDEKIYYVYTKSNGNLYIHSYGADGDILLKKIE